MSVRTVAHMLILIPISFFGLGAREPVRLLILAPGGTALESPVAFSMLSFIAILIRRAWGGAHKLFDLLTPPDRAMTR